MSQQKPRQRGGRVLDKATPELFCFNVCSTGSAVFFRSVG